MEGQDSSKDVQEKQKKEELEIVEEIDDKQVGKVNESIHEKTDLDYNEKPFSLETNPPEKNANLTQKSLKDKLKEADSIILVIGETGSGKSTIINTLINSMENHSLQDLKIVSDIENNFEGAAYENSYRIELDENYTIKNISSKCVHTKQVEIIRVHFNNKCICFIDTPGIIQMDSKESDNDWAELIENVIGTAIDEINFIFFISKYDQYRLNPSLCASLNLVNSILKKYEIKVITIFTHYAGKNPDHNLNNIPFKSEHTININNNIYSKLQKSIKKREKLEGAWNKINIKAGKIINLLV